MTTADDRLAEAGQEVLDSLFEGEQLWLSIGVNPAQTGAERRAAISRATQRMGLVQGLLFAAEVAQNEKKTFKATRTYLAIRSALPNPFDVPIDDEISTPEPQLPSEQWVPDVTDPHPTEKFELRPDGDGDGWG